MKELTIEEKAKAYDKALTESKKFLALCKKCGAKDTVDFLERIFPELKDSEDERVRKKLIDLIYKVYANTSYITCVEHEDMLAWLEKQGEFKSNKWTEGDVVRHGGVLALVINGRKAMKSNCEQITIQYPDEWVKTGTKERKYFFEELEKQGEQNLIMAKSPQLGEQKPFDYEDANIQQKDFAPKSAMEAAKEEKADNANKVEPKDYRSIDPHFFKTTDKVEPKFKVGDWVVENNVNRNPVQITSFEEDKGVGIKVWLSNGTGTYVDFLKGYHKWTIEDAKDGDVLCYKDEISLYKHDIKNCTKQEPTFGGFVYHCCYDGKRFITDSLYSLTEKDKKDIYPANKEQRDTLERAMADAGYTFNFEKKELKKISNALEDCEIVHIEHGKYYYCIKDYYAGGNKRASKGDVVQALNGMSMMALGVKANEYFIPVNTIRQNPAWTEEDNMMIEETLYFLREYQHSNRCKDENGMQNSVTCEKWLKSLEDRVGCEANCTTTKEWNESDKEEFQIAIDTLVEAGQHDSAHWLKSLKQRIGG